MRDMAISQQLAAVQQSAPAVAGHFHGLAQAFPPDVIRYRSFPREILNFHRLLTAILGCNLPKRRTVLVKNPYIVLSQKEQDVARVRKEIQALLTVIPLLADSPPSWDELQTQLLSSCPDIEHSVKDGMAALELYYPFVRNLQKHSLDGRLG